MKENIAEIIFDISVTYKWRFWMNQFLIWLVNLDLVQPLIYNNIIIMNVRGISLKSQYRYS